MSDKRQVTVVLTEAKELAARAPFDAAGSDTYWDRLEDADKEGPREDASLILAALSRLFGEGSDGGA